MSWEGELQSSPFLVVVTCCPLDLFPPEDDNRVRKEVITMPEFSGSFSGRATLQTTIIASDVPDHQLNLVRLRSTFFLVQG